MMLITSVNLMKNVNMEISEIHYQVNKVGQQIKTEFLEWELSNGNVSLMEKVLSGRSLDLFDEYVQMDISNGIEELNELLDEWKKANALNVKEEDRKKILNALDGLKDVKAPDVSRLTAELGEDLKNIENTRNEQIPDNAVSLIFQKFFAGPIDGLKKVIEFLKVQNVDNLTTNDIDELKKGMSAYADMFTSSLAFTTMDSMLPTPIVDPLKRIEDEIDVVKNSESMNLSVFIDEMELIVEFRDSNLVGKVKEIVKKLEDTVEKIKGIEIRTEVLEEYEKIDSVSEFSNKLIQFSHSVRRVARQFYAMKRRWSPTINYLDQLELPSGNLSELFAHECPPFYESLDIGSLSTVLQPIQDTMPTVLKMKESTDIMRTRNFSGLAARLRNEDILKNDLLNITLETLETSFEAIKTFHALIQEVQKEWAKIDLGEAARLTGVILMKLNNSKEIIDCYSQMKTDDVKPLVELPPKIWNFDPKPTRHLVETVLGIKKIHGMMVELNEWKFEKKIENFGLDEQDVNAIQDGIEVVEQLGDINGLLKEMDELSGVLNGSEVEEAWNTVRSALNQLNSELSDHLPTIDTNLTHLRSAISAIQLPSDLPIQLIIDWVNGNLKGVVRSEFENTLQRLIRMDFDNYEKKLDEMNRAIEKWSGNKDKEEEENKEEEDCLVNYSEKCKAP
uniref:WSN domain-containing protein n=1 Tax=Caenorhabditis tropicalis TaxID=1561998 RepID=A0A1I7UI66_9PELO